MDNFKQRTIKDIVKLSGEFFNVGMPYVGLALDNIVVKASDDLFQGTSLEQELDSEGRLMTYGDIFRLFYTINELPDGNIRTTPKDFRDSIPAGDEKRLSFLMNLYENLTLWSIGDKRDETTDEQRKVVRDALAKVTAALREMGRALAKKDRTDLLNRMRDSMESAARNARGQTRPNDDLAPSKAIGMGGRDKYIKFLELYRNRQQKEKSLGIIKRWASENLNFVGNRGRGDIPLDESVKAINPQSRYTLEQLARDKDKLVRASAKKTIKIMKETTITVNGEEMSLYEKQKHDAAKLMSQLSRLEEDPRAAFDMHYMLTDRMSKLMTKKNKNESLSDSLSRKKGLYDVFLFYEKVFDGPAPNTRSKIDNSRASVKYLREHIEIDDSSGRLVIPILSTKQAKNIRVAVNSGDDASEYIRRILSGQARVESKKARSAVEEICDDIAKFRYAKRYISDAQKRLSIVDQALNSGNVPSENIRAAKDIARDLRERISTVKKGIETGNRAQIRSVDLLFDEESNKYNSHPQPMVMVDRHLGIPGLKWSPALANLRKNMRTMEDGTKAKFSRNPDHYRDRPASKNLWWEEYTSKIAHAKLYRNEYEYDAAGTMVVLASPPSNQNVLENTLMGKDVSDLTMDEKKVVEHIRELTSGSTTQFRVGRTIGDLPNVWPQFLPKNEDPDVPSDVLKEGYYLCIKAIASLVGYSGDIPTDLNSMQEVFAKESMKAEVRKMVKDIKDMSDSERTKDDFVPDEISDSDEKYIKEVTFNEEGSGEDFVDFSEPLPEGYTREAPQQDLNADKNLNTGIPAIPTQDDTDQSAYPGAVYNESALEDGVSYTVMISGHGVEDIVGPQFVFSRGGGGGVPMSTIRTFMRTPSYTIVKTDSLG